VGRVNNMDDNKLRFLRRISMSMATDESDRERLLRQQEQSLAERQRAAALRALQSAPDRIAPRPPREPEFQGGLSQDELMAMEQRLAEQELEDRIKMQKPDPEVYRELDPELLARHMARYQSGQDAKMDAEKRKEILKKIIEEQGTVRKYYGSQR